MVPATGVPLSRIERKEIRFLSPEEVGQLADSIAPRYRALVLVGATFVAGGIAQVEFTGTGTSVSGDRRLLAQRIGQEVHGAAASIAKLLGPKAEGK